MEISQSCKNTVYACPEIRVRPVSPDILQAGNVVATALAVSLDKPLEWAVGFFFGNTELSLEFWNVIAGISGFDD
jgi:hypothetical protein